MAAGEYISMSAQRELFERELELEAKELLDRPESEHKELQKIYEARGLEPELASLLASKMMGSPEQALRTHAREELGINPENLGSPWQASLSSMVATAFGGLVPLISWFFVAGTAAIVASIILVGLVAVIVGLALAKFTGKSYIFTAFRQLAICSICATATFVIGRTIGVSAIH